MKYAVIIEKGELSYGAYVPDLPGCVAGIVQASARAWAAWPGACSAAA